MNSKFDEFLKRAKMKRIEVRLNLNTLYLPYYDLLCEQLKDTLWFPYMGLRTLEIQSELFSKGREPASIRRGEKIVTYAMAGDSAHNWGCATDWVEYRPEWGIKEIWSKSDWDFYGEACKSVGLVWGGGWKKFPDKPHNELPISGSWASVGDEFRKNGALWINEFIQKKLKE